MKILLLALPFACLVPTCAVRPAAPADPQPGADDAGAACASFDRGPACAGCLAALASEGRCAPAPFCDTCATCPAGDDGARPLTTCDCVADDVCLGCDGPSVWACRLASCPACASRVPAHE